MEEFITKKDRTKNVKNYEYGDIESNDLSEYDKPLFATIEYNRGEVIFEDYSKLDEFLLKEFIPNNIQTKVNKSRNTKDLDLEKPYKSVQLNALVKLGLCEKEMQHAIELFEKEGIHIGGYSQELDGEYTVYDYISTYRNLKDSEPLNWPITYQQFIDYKKTGDKKIRQILIESNMRLIPFVTWHMAKYYNIDREELDSYGYESLIIAVDTFNPYFGTRFSTYAITCIKHGVLNAIAKMKGLSSNTLGIYKKYTKLRERIEEITGKDVFSNSQALWDFINFLSDELITSIDKVIDNVRRFWPNEVSLNEIIEDNDIESKSNLEDSTLSKVHLEDLKKRIMGIISEYPLKKQLMIKLRYGFIDGEPKTYNEIAKILGLSTTRISQCCTEIERKIFRRLSLNYSYYDYMNGYIGDNARLNEINETIDEFGYSKEDDYIMDSHRISKK